MKKKFLSIQHKTFEELGVKSYKELWAKVQGEYEGLSIPAATKFVLKSKSEDGKKKVFHAIFSSATEDRHGEIVYQVFHLENYRKNPVLLDSHNYDSIKRIIGRVEPIDVMEGQLQGDVEYAIKNPLGLLGEQLTEDGFLNTTSIGFIPKVFDDQGNILESELLEISAVSVPANPEALFEKEKEAPVKKEVKAESTKEVKTVDKKVVLGKVAARMANDQDSLLKSLAKNVRELVESGDKGKSRKVYQIIRQLAEN